VISHQEAYGKFFIEVDEEQYRVNSFISFPFLMCSELDVLSGRTLLDGGKGHYHGSPPIS
jgi:hypothetical protein